MEFKAGVLLVVSLSCLVSLSYSIDCFVCSNLKDPDYCTNSEACPVGGDSCYELKATKSDGSNFYNLGCATADPSGCTCMQGQSCSGDMDCCDTDGCNSLGKSEDLDIDVEEGASTGDNSASYILVPSTVFIIFMTYLLA